MGHQVVVAVVVEGHQVWAVDQAAAVVEPQDAVAVLAVAEEHQVLAVAVDPEEVLAVLEIVLAVGEHLVWVADPAVEQLLVVEVLHWVHQVALQVWAGLLVALPEVQVAWEIQEDLAALVTLVAQVVVETLLLVHLAWVADHPVVSSVLVTDHQDHLALVLHLETLVGRLGCQESQPWESPAQNCL